MNCIMWCEMLKHINFNIAIKSHSTNGEENERFIKYWIKKKMLPSRQNCRKSSVEESIFDNMASHIECWFNKNSLLQCYFLAILPAGMICNISSRAQWKIKFIREKNYEKISKKLPCIRRWYIQGFKLRNV